jgi:hypothetical protein
MNEKNFQELISNQLNEDSILSKVEELKILGGCDDDDCDDEGCNLRINIFCGKGNFFADCKKVCY